MTHQAVLGLGGTVDYELAWDAAVIGGLATEFGIGAADLVPPDEIGSERELVVSLLCHLREGSGGEHFVATPAIVEGFAGRFAYRVTIGGTPVRAAIAMSALGIPSTVHLVSIDDTVRRLLPSDVDYLCSADEDSLNPHLIMQYPVGAHIRLHDADLVAPAGNRLIYPSDEPNRQLRLSSHLGSALRSARVFLVSGFNSIQEREVLDDRLAQLLDAMECLPNTATVVYEDAAFHVPEFGAIARSAFAGRLDVYSLNEDELMAYSGRRVDLLDPADVASALRELHAKVDAPIAVLHTRHYALAHGTGAGEFGPVLAEGVAFAGARYAVGDGVTRDEIERLAANGERSAEGIELVAAIERLGAGEFLGVPALDLRGVPNPTMIGLGDTFMGGIVAALVTQKIRTPDSV